MCRHFNTDFNKAAIPQAPLTASCKCSNKPTKQATWITWRNVTYIQKVKKKKYYINDKTTVTENKIYDILPYILESNPHQFLPIP